MLRTLRVRLYPTESRRVLSKKRFGRMSFAWNRFFGRFEKNLEGRRRGFDRKKKELRNREKRRLKPVRVHPKLDDARVDLYGLVGSGGGEWMGVSLRCCVWGRETGEGEAALLGGG